MSYVCKAYLRSSPIYVTPLDQNAGFHIQNSVIM